MLQLDETGILATDERQFYDLKDYKLIKNIPVFVNCIVNKFIYKIKIFNLFIIFFIYNKYFTFNFRFLYQD